MATTHQRPDVDPIARAHEAKDPVTAAAGPYGHPFHPILVTIPIGLWTGALVFDLASRIRDGGAPTLVDASFWMIGIGIVGALLAALFGLLDLLTIPRGTRAFRAGVTHMALNLVVVALFAVNFLWRAGDHTGAEVELGQLVLTAVAVAVLSASGWIGGMLAYRYGVRVADEQTQAEGYRR